MKRNFKRIIMAAAILALIMSLMLNVGAGVFAEEAEGGTDSTDATLTQDNTIPENSEENTVNYTESGEITDNSADTSTESGDYEINLFEEIYTLIQDNADKIFSVLAFIGTLVVGICYKSGLLPLLSDALSKLKGSIDGVKADSETTKALTEERLQSIGSAVNEMNGSLQNMKWQYESYDQLCRERESMRLILEGQIDMLYAIFMSSALPQYQKEEVGERICEMREELKSYERKTEK